MADQVIIRRAGHQELDVLDAADIPALPYYSNTADLPVADGGTGAGTAAGARTNLGLVIGTDVAAPSAIAATKLDDFAAPDDNTDLNATTSQHGLLPKLGGGSTNFLRADGTWNAPGGGGDAVWPAIPPSLSAALNLNWSHMQMVANPGAATRTVSGMLGGPANSGTVTSGDDADGAWQLLTTAASANNEATMYTATMFRRDWGAIASGVFKTPSAFAVGVWNISFSSAGLGTAAVPATHCAGFRYSTAADGTAFWRTATNNATTGTVQATSVAVVASTVYRWVIRLLPSSVEYYMATGDGALALVATETATLPTATTPLTLVTRVLTLENVAKTMLWGRYTILTRP